MARLSDVRNAWRFLGAGLRRFDRTASLVPSSRWLVGELLAHVPLANARCVVELGPGVGTVTRAILERIAPDAHVHAIDLDGTFLQLMREAIPDPRLRPIHGSAVDADRLVAQDGCELGADAVVSSLGLSMMPTTLREGVLRATTALMLPEARFVQYQYAHSRAMSWQPGEGFHPFDGAGFLRRYFEQVERSFVARNVPPAFVYACGGPRHARVVKPVRRRLRVVGRR